MHTSRGRLLPAVARYAEASDEELGEASPPGPHSRPQAAPSGCREGLPAGHAPAGRQQQQPEGRATAAAAAAALRGGSGPHRVVAKSGLDEWEEAELAQLSPESQKRERRRIANRDCARRIRQRQSVRRPDWRAVGGAAALAPTFLPPPHSVPWHPAPTRRR